MTRTRYIMGKHCLEEVLRHTPQRVLTVFTAQQSPTDPFYQQLIEKRVKIKKIAKHELSHLVGSESHQSYVAEVSELPTPDLASYFDQQRGEKYGLVLMLDSIFDPQNLGAILRAAECFGVDLVLFSKNRGSDITPVVAKTSAGATELVPWLKVSNLVETLKVFQKEGFWAVACEVGKRSQPLHTFAFPEKTLLILGSEGEGVQPLLSKKSDFHVSIAMMGKIDSLNVSQAAAVFLSHYKSGIT